MYELPFDTDEYIYWARRHMADLLAAYDSVIVIPKRGNESTVGFRYSHTGGHHSKIAECQSEVETAISTLTFGYVSYVIENTSLICSATDHAIAEQRVNSLIAETSGAVKALFTLCSPSGELSIKVGTAIEWLIAKEIPIYKKSKHLEEGTVELDIEKVRDLGLLHYEIHTPIADQVAVSTAMWKILPGIKPLYGKSTSNAKYPFYGLYDNKSYKVTFRLKV